MGKFEENNIRYEYYISMNCFIEDFMKRYINEVVVSPENYEHISSWLKKLNFHPNIYVIGLKEMKEENFSDNTFFFQSYSELVERLIKKGKQRVSNKEGINNCQIKGNKIAVKILKKADSQPSEELIFEQTLKAKALTY